MTLSNLRRLSLFAGLLALVVWTVPGAANDLYRVSGVPVDVTADSAVQARAEALARGRRQAYDQLITRLVPSDAVDVARLVTEESLGQIVQGFEVEEERSSAVRYLAKLTFNFDPAVFRRLMSELGVGFAETRSLPVLFLPLLDRGGRVVLWEEPNPWREAWYRLPPQDGLVPIALPYGDLADIQDLTTSAAAGGDETALSRIAERYGARDAVVARAEPAPNGAIQLTVQRFGPSGNDRTLLESVTFEEVLNEPKRFDVAVRQVVALVEEAWKADNLIRDGVQSRVTATVPIDGLQRWVKVRQTLDQVAVLNRYEVIQLTRNEALVDLWVNGDAEQLRVALAQRDLTLIPGAGDYILYMRGQKLPEMLLPSAPLVPAKAEEKSEETKTEEAAPVVVPADSSTEPVVTTDPSADSEPATASETNQSIAPVLPKQQVQPTAPVVAPLAN